jgi:hypothetical protein
VQARSSPPSIGPTGQAGPARMKAHVDTPCLLSLSWLADSPAPPSLPLTCLAHLSASSSTSHSCPSWTPPVMGIHRCASILQGFGMRLMPMAPINSGPCTHHFPQTLIASHSPSSSLQRHRNPKPPPPSLLRRSASSCRDNLPEHRIRVRNLSVNSSTSILSLTKCTTSPELSYRTQATKSSPSSPLYRRGHP